ncbi:aminoglycoside 3-N-acetyltransferase [Streptacidiphilus sp. MAP12-16]|uniref:aminoglycoside N(3)-acetyltransferase n=1 Tax=Streptacidiphilus sp. MAP12-16 TaxID=3156300 RepID=UPI0035134FB8
MPVPGSRQRGAEAAGAAGSGSGVRELEVEGLAGGHSEEGLLRDLVQLGVCEGDTLFVQSSLRSIGRVDGGAAAVVRALRRALGADGTLVAYTATPENSTSSREFRAATAGLGEAALERHRSRMAAFDPLTTPCSPSVGRLSEEIRTTPGALRSSHPQTSFAALGPQAEKIVWRHPLDCHLGDESPLGRLYEQGASALLIGIPDWLCTGYHLAEYRVPRRPLRHYSCLVADAQGVGRWRNFEDLDLDDRHFPALGASVRQEVDFGTGRLGDADCFRVPLVEAVDAAARWLLHNDPSDPDHTCMVDERSDRAVE